MNDNRRQFLERVQRALQKETTHGQADLAYSALPSPGITSPPSDILSILADSAKEANIQITLAADVSAAAKTISDVVNSIEPEWKNQDAVIAWNHPLLEQVDVKRIVEALDVEFFSIRADQKASLTERDRETFRRQLMKSKIGITSADFCIAETATLVLRTRAGQPGAVSLVPSVHVAVILASQVLPDFVSFYALLEQQQGKDPDALTHRMTLISGPSKTGDIELVMVHGAHGPRALHLVVINDAS